MKKTKSWGLKNAKMGTKLAIIAGLVIVLGFAALNLFSVTYSGNKLEEAGADEMNQICETNVQKVNIVTNLTSNVADSILDALDVMYSQSDVIEEGEVFHSAATGVAIPKSRYEAETVIINNIWSAVKQNDSILGVGVFFEPNAFSHTVDNYAPYGYGTDLENRKLTLFEYNKIKDRPYYTAPKKDMAITFSDAYVDQVSGENAIAATYPIIYNGKFMGIVIIDLKSTVFEILEAKNEKFPSMYVNVMNGNRNILYSSHADVIGKNFAEAVGADVYSQMDKEFSNGKSFNIETAGEGGNVLRYCTPVNVGASTWWVQTALSASEFNAARNTLNLVLNLIGLAVVLLSVIVIILVLKRMLKPMAQMQKAALEMANGSLNVNIDYESKDEIGVLADSMRTFTNAIKAIISDLIYILGEMAKGNFTVTSQAEEKYIGDYAPLRDSLETIIGGLNKTMSEIKVSSEQVNSGAEQVSSAAQALSQGATEQASSVEELAATMAEISGQIKNNAEKSRQAREISRDAGDEIVLSNRKMEEMSAAMADITEKSNEIGKIIKTIDDIAFQTNILALNAAVEAARAGAAGKGFAVVADEVRNLAGKSAEAAKNTTVLIEGAIEAISNGDKLTAETAKSLRSVSENSEKIVELINEISEASSEQANGVSQINLGLEQISSVVQTNSATAEESAAASEELSGQANMMNQLISTFTLADENQDTESFAGGVQSQSSFSGSGDADFATSKY